MRTETIISYSGADESKKFKKQSVETKKQSFESKQVINVYPEGKDDGRSSPENIPKEEKKRKQSEFSNSAGSDLDALKRIREDSDEDEQQLTDREIKKSLVSTPPLITYSNPQPKMSGHCDKIMKAIHKKLEDCRDPNPIHLKHLNKALDQMKSINAESSQPFLFDKTPKLTRSPRHSRSPPGKYRSLSGLRQNISSASHLVDLNRRLTVLSKSKDKIDDGNGYGKISLNDSLIADRSFYKAEIKKKSNAYIKSVLGDSKNSIERRTFDANFEEKKIEKLNHLFSRCFGSKGKLNEKVQKTVDPENKYRPKRDSPTEEVEQKKERKRTDSKSRSLDKRLFFEDSSQISIAQFIKEGQKREKKSRESNKKTSSGKKRLFYTSEDLNNNTSTLFSNAINEKLKNTSIDAEKKIYRTLEEIKSPLRNNVQMILEKTKQLGLISNSGKMSANFLSACKNSKPAKETQAQAQFNSQTKYNSKSKLPTTMDFQVKMPTYDNRNEHINSKIDPFLFDKGSSLMRDKSYARNYMMKTSYHTSNKLKKPFEESNSTIAKQSSQDLRFRAKDASQAFLQLKKKMVPTTKLLKQYPTII